MKHSKRYISIRLSTLMTALSLFCAMPAQAAFNKPFFTACSNGCSNVQQSCYDACFDSHCILGKLFCSGAVGICTNTCQLNQTTCKDNCYIFASDIDSVARAYRNGRTVRVTGPLVCEKGTKVHELRVTVTQAEVPIVAEGRGAVVECTDEEQGFTVDAVVQGRGEFLVPGQVTICALAQISAPGIDVATKQWCRNVLLVSPDVQFSDDPAE